MSYFGAKNYGLEVARGNISGVSSINKFGKNIEIDSGVTADIWSRGKTLASGGTSLLWVAPTAARQHTIASSDANDTTGGSGARTVKVYGLTAWDAAEVSETVTMNTGTPPTTSNSYVIIHRMKVLTTGSGITPNQGLITATAASDGTITAAIEIDEGQTMMAIYGVPSTQTLYITELGIAIGKAGGAATGFMDIDLVVNQEPDVQRGAFTHKHHTGLSAAGTSSKTMTFDPPKTIAGPAIIKMQANSGTNDMDCAAWFNGYLVTN